VRARSHRVIGNAENRRFSLAHSLGRGRRSRRPIPRRTKAAESGGRLISGSFAMFTAIRRALSAGRIDSRLDNAKISVPLIREVKPEPECYSSHSSSLGPIPRQRRRWCCGNAAHCRRRTARQLFEAAVMAGTARAGRCERWLRSVTCRAAPAAWRYSPRSCASRVYVRVAPASNDRSLSSGETIA
jgi:hypothetical protein